MKKVIILKLSLIMFLAISCGETKKNKKVADTNDVSGFVSKTVQLQEGYYGSFYNVTGLVHSSCTNSVQYIVCGNDNNTYLDECSMRQANTPKFQDGPCSID